MCARGGRVLGAYHRRVSWWKRKLSLAVEEMGCFFFFAFSSPWLSLQFNTFDPVLDALCSIR